METFPVYKEAKVDDLIPYARNSRVHSDEQVTKIAASIKEFGFLNPVIVDGANGIIAGHGRIMAAKKLGMETVPVVEASHLTDAQRRAYVIADNRLALDATWDEELLAIEFAELGDLGFDLGLTGFELSEIEDVELGLPLGQESERGREIDDGKYTTKIDTPIYEIKGEKPEVDDLYDNKKTGDLASRIENTDMPDDVRGFLMAAATRHTVFNYEKIAEFYAHQDKEIKDLMEESALVIVDYDKAIENGYVSLSKALMALSEESDNG